MISVERVRELIKSGNENRNLDYKGGFSWDTANNDEKCQITKDILAFSNTRDGGVIVIGVNDQTGAIEGLTAEEYASFDQTKFNDFSQRYTDPRHTCNVRRLLIDEKRLVVIDVPEFADVPILCGRDANSSSNSNRLILRKASLYKRTDRATSQPVEDADEMRELLNRGLLRRQDDLLRAIKQIIEPNKNTLSATPGGQFEAEIEKANLYFSELNDGAFAQLPHWTVRMQPGTYAASRIPNATTIQSLTQQSAISLRGWTFPIVGRVGGATWTNFDGGSQSFYSSQLQRPEAIRVYKSGLVVWCSGMGEDSWGDMGQDSISFIGLIYSVTEWLLFARRFFETILSVEDSLLLTVSASGIRGRKLISADPHVHIWQEYRTEVPAFQISESVGVSELRADPEETARKIIKKVFELFNWNDPVESMLYGWQQKLIQRQY